jgi:Ca2+:H+ antiporter
MYFLLVFAVAAPVLDLLRVPPPLLFIIAGLGILPLAALIGQAVEQIAEHTGERVGGLLFATFGNATELIIGIFALSQGLVDVVSASIIGSVLGNALLVLGVAICVGGFKHGRLEFEVRPASQYASLLALCIGGLLLPTVATLLAQRSHLSPAFIADRSALLSDFIAVLLLVGYAASILFSVFRLGDPEEGKGEDLEPVLGARSLLAVTRLLAYRYRVAKSSVPGKTGVLRQIDGTVQAIVSHETARQSEKIVPQAGAEAQAAEAGAAPPPTHHELPIVSALTHDKEASTADALSQSQKPPQEQERKAPLWRSLVLLTVATVGVGILSEILVGSIEPMTQILHWNTAFVGLVFVPLIGGLPEYFNTISMALDKRMGMVLAASAGSSIQIALLMAPILVLVSLLTPKRLDLVFSIIELAVLGLATFLFSEITRDGELVWLEGLLLILLYAMMGGTVFLFGS